MQRKSKTGFVGSPAAEEIRTQRKLAGLTQTQAAELVRSNLQTWQGWEYGRAPMHAGLWELFTNKTDGIVQARESVELNKTLKNP